MNRLFPGIDPYLEAQGYWPDFHATFLTYLRDAINDRLPDRYEARIDERVSLVVPPATAEARLFRPDVAVVERAEPMGAPWQDVASAMAVLVATEPVIIPLVFLEEERETYVEILHRPDRSLVNVIELLSPANKTCPGRGQYWSKRDALLRQPVHVTEFDFLTNGRRVPMARPLPRGDYFAFVARGDRRPDCEVYPWTVRQPLPTVALPLLHPDPDLPLDLAAVFATAYDRGRYARSIDYAAALSLPLAPEDRAWAEGLAGAGRGNA